MSSSPSTPPEEKKTPSNDTTNESAEDELETIKRFNSLPKEKQREIIENVKKGLVNEANSNQAEWIKEDLETLRKRTEESKQQQTENTEVIQPKEKKAPIEATQPPAEEKQEVVKSDPAPATKEETKPNDATPPPTKSVIEDKLKTKEETPKTENTPIPPVEEKKNEEVKTEETKSQPDKVVEKDPKAGVENEVSPEYVGKTIDKLKEQNGGREPSLSELEEYLDQNGVPHEHLRDTGEQTPGLSSNYEEEKVGENIDWNQVVDSITGETIRDPVLGNGQEPGGYSNTTIFATAAMVGALIYYFKKKRDQNISDEDDEYNLQKAWNNQTWNAFFKDPFSRRKDGNNDDFDKIL